MAAETDSILARLTYSHYFKFVRGKDKNVIVKCNLCATPRELPLLRNRTKVSIVVGCGSVVFHMNRPRL